ncbi:MAG: EAL domain-containing protein [Hyphomicrobiaceae bacterium]
MLRVRNATIASRLYLVGGLTLLSVAALVAGTIVFAVGMRRVVDVLYQSGIVRAAEASELELLLEKHRRLVTSARLEFDLDKLQQDKQEAHGVQASIERLVAGSNDRFAMDLRPMLPPFWQAGDETLRLAESFAQGAAPVALRQYVAQAESLQRLVRQYRHSRLDDARVDVHAMTDRARTLVQWTLGFALLVALLIGPLGYFILHRMVRRLRRVTATMGQLVRQDTDVDVGSIASSDEIGEMARAVSVFEKNALQLQQLNRWLDVALNNMTRGMSMFDAEQRLVVCNSVYVQIYDMPEDLARPGTEFSKILACRAQLVSSVDGHVAETDAGLEPALRDLVERRTIGERRQRLKNGRTIEVQVKPLAWGGWVAFHEDVTDQLLAAEKMERLARQDALTGVANRRHFRECLEEALAKLDVDNSFALAVIDLDGFKEVNDTLGHPIGDAVLANVGCRLRDLARHGDIVARLGGDEFAIIQRDVQEKADADALARRVMDALRQPFILPDKHIEIGGTIGIALAPLDGWTAEDLMQKADIALYRAKASGKSTWRFYDHEMEARLRARRQLEADLRGAVEREEFVLFFQPIVSFASRRVEGCEALIRWHHPVRGMISPAEFIPLAEETGLICKIGAWALGAACRTAATWPDQHVVSVNLSVAQFSGPDLADVTADALRQSGLAATRLVLEVTETLLLGDDPATLELLHRLRNLGVAIALDDFGTGYSSLSHLRRFPFDKIKIDQSFVRDLPQRRNCEAIVGAIARLASCLDMTTVAEGVETEDHLARVGAAGCDSVQGYLFSRPVPANELAGVVAEIDERLASGRVMAA